MSKDPTPAKHRLLTGILHGDATEVVKALRDGADPSASFRVGGEAGGVPLLGMIWAASNGDEPTVRALLSFGADPFARDAYGDSAGHVAAKMGRANCLETLLEFGWDWREIGQQGLNARELAERHHYFDCLRAIDEREASANEKKAMEAEIQENPADKRAVSKRL